MRSLVSFTAIVALASSGCFTSWAVTQIAGTQSILDEGVREQAVPVEGVRENFTVSIPLAIEVEVITQPGEARAGQTTPQTTTRKELPFALTCSTAQYARDRVYHSAFRYGSRWKKIAGGMFLAEAAFGALMYLLDRGRDLDDPKKASDRSGLVAAGFLAADALGTAAIFFIPRKEIFTVDDKPVNTPLRTDCPDGLVLEIAGESYRVDAAGGIGELGELALDDWMQAPTGELVLSLAGRVLPLQMEQREICAWNRAHHPEQQTACGIDSALPRKSIAIITVPTGTLTSEAAPAP